MTDDSQYDHRFTGTGISYQRGRTGQAVSVGPASAIRIAGAAPLDTPTGTIEAWVNARVIGRRMTVLESTAPWVMQILASGSLMCSAPGGYALVPAAIIPGVWTSLACTFDGTTVMAWVNGARGAQGPSLPLRPGGVDGVTIGGGTATGQEKLDGLVDNVRLWRAIRTPQQICASAHSCQ